LETIGERRGHRLLQERRGLKPGQLGSHLRGIALVQLERRRHRDHRCVELFALFLGDIGAQRFQHLGRKILRPHPAPARPEHILKARAHAALELQENVVLGALVGRLRTRVLTDPEVARTVDVNGRRGDVRIDVVFNHLGPRT